MFFNPLFIQEMSGTDAGIQKKQKLGNSTYLFSDIMNVQIRKGGNMSEAGKASEEISLKDLRSLSELSELSGLSEEEAVNILSQLLAQFGLSGNIMAQLIPANEALSGAAETDGETAFLDLGMNIEEAASKIMDLLKQNKDVTLQLADGNESFLLKLQAQESLGNKELSRLQNNSKFNLEIEKNLSEAVSLERRNTAEQLNIGQRELTAENKVFSQSLKVNVDKNIKVGKNAETAGTAKETTGVETANRNIWTVEKSAEMLKALRPQKTHHTEGIKTPELSQETSAGKSLTGPDAQVNKERHKADKRLLKAETAGVSKVMEDNGAAGKKVSAKKDNSDFAGDIQKEETDLASSLKADSAKPQEAKTGESVKTGDKDFSQHITAAGKELKTEALKAAKNESSAPTVKTVKIAEVMNEISQFIKQKDKQIVVLKIEPENLGKLRIALEVSNKSLDAKIHVENEQVKAIVESNAKQLTQSLVQNGIQLNSLTVSLSNSEQKTGKQPAFNGKRKGSGARGVEDIEIEKTEVKDINKKLGYNTYEYLA